MADGLVVVAAPDGPPAAVFSRGCLVCWSKQCVAAETGPALLLPMFELLEPGLAVPPPLDDCAAAATAPPITRIPASRTCFIICFAP